MHAAGRRRWLSDQAQPTDEQLQAAFTGLSKLTYLPQLLKNEVLAYGDELVAQEVVSGYAAALPLLLDLLNPLLVRYAFDPVDFLQGARVAVKEVVQAVHSQELVALRTLHPPGGGGATHSTSSEVAFLRDTLGPALFDAVVQPRSPGTPEEVVEEVRVRGAQLLAVTTEVVQGRVLGRALLQVCYTTLPRDEEVRGRWLLEACLSAAHPQGCNEEEEMMCWRVHSGL